MTDQDRPDDTAGVDANPENDVPENEMMREIRALHDQEVAAKKSEAERQAGKQGRGWKTAAGIGIGSAALLAALLFANRDKDGPGD